MSKLTITALATFAVMLVLSFSSSAQAQNPKAQSKKCAVAKLNLKNTMKPGDEVEAKVLVNSCADENQVVSVRYKLTDPCGNSMNVGQSTVRLKKRGVRQTTVTFQGPSPSDCPGDYTLTAEVRSKGAVVATGSTTFAVN